MGSEKEIIHSKFGEDIDRIVEKHPDIKEELEKLILNVYKYGYERGYNDGWNDAKEEMEEEEEPYERVMG